MLFVFLNWVIMIKVIVMQNECLGGKDPDLMNNKEYLIEFAKGPCAPLLIVPPLTGSKLQLVIDCEVLQQKSPEIFNTCGFTHCEKNPWEIWKNVPNKEYRLWISEFNSPVSFFTLSPQISKCWASFMAINFEQNNNLLKEKGFEIKLHGQTNETKGEGKCGFETCTKLSPSFFQITKSLLLFYWYQQCKEMGYKNGLTFQILPYDWRKSMKENELNYYFKDNLTRLYQITNKKVVILAHSYGVINGYYQISKLSQQEKDQMIKVFMMVGGNLHGVLEADYSLVMPNLPYSLGIFKIHYEGELIAFSQNIGLIENSMRDDSYFKNQDWYKAILKRKQYEEGFTKKDESGYDFLPSIEEDCSPSNFTFVSTKCIFGFSNDEDYLVRVKDQYFYKNNIHELPQQEAYFENTYKLRMKYDNKEIFQLDNPGVSTVSFILRSNPTPIKLEWDDNLKYYQKNKIYYKPQVSFGNGDGSIGINSLMYGPLKWAWEFKHGYQGSKPHKIIDICSTYNIKSEIYDNENREITKNEFFGIKCECQNDEVPVECDHGNIMADENVLEIGKNALLTNENGYNEKYEKFINSLDWRVIQKWISNDCPQIHFQDNQIFQFENSKIQYNLIQQNYSNIKYRQIMELLLQFKSKTSSIMQEKQINLKVVCGQYETVKFTIKNTTPLGKLFQKYIERNNLNMTHVNFIYNGQRVNEEDTPQILGMESDEEITCMIIQTGGQLIQYILIK